MGTHANFFFIIYPYQVCEDGLGRAKGRQASRHGIDHFTYFERTWLGGQFAPAKWNVHSEEGPIERTIILKGGTAR